MFFFTSQVFSGTFGALGTFLFKGIKFTCRSLEIRTHVAPKESGRHLGLQNRLGPKEWGRDLKRKGVCKWGGSLLLSFLHKLSNIVYSRGFFHKNSISLFTTPLPSPWMEVKSEVRLKVFRPYNLSRGLVVGVGWLRTPSILPRVQGCQCLVSRSPEDFSYFGVEPIQPRDPVYCWTWPPGFRPSGTFSEPSSQ